MKYSYRFPVTKPGKLYKPPGGLFDQDEDKEQIGVIQGRTPGSKEEWWVALGLWKLKHTFIYQYQVFGGYGIRGGQIVDFLVVSTIPRSTFIQVFGGHWHSGLLGSEDQFKLAQLENEGGDVVVLWGKDLPNADAAYSILLSKIGPA
jgi:hypothetical protein